MARRAAGSIYFILHNSSFIISMRKATPEQKAAKAARREQFRALVKQVAAMSDAERAQIVSRVGAILTCEGRQLSPVNTTLLLMQMPNASLVGGFRQWLKAGRAVKKGNHGAMIWVPIKKGRQAEPDPPEDADEEKPETEAGGGTTRFVIGTVFDISQTEELTAEQAAKISQHSNTPSLQFPNSDDMRFDPTNPQKVPAMVPAAKPPRKRGQQIIPPAPVAVQPPANIIDLNSVVFEAAPSHVPAAPVLTAVPAPAPTVQFIPAVPRWRRAAG